LTVRAFAGLACGKAKARRSATSRGARSCLLMRTSIDELSIIQWKPISWRGRPETMPEGQSKADSVAETMQPTISVILLGAIFCVGRRGGVVGCMDGMWVHRAHRPCVPRGKPQCLCYQTRQTFSGGLTMGWPGLQAKAWANSGMFTTTPLMRYWAGECGSTWARMRKSSGRSFAQSHWA